MENGGINGQNQIVINFDQEVIAIFIIGTTETTHPPDPVYSVDFLTPTKYRNRHSFKVV
jgi:hypothetical protein